MYAKDAVYGHDGPLQIMQELPVRTLPHQRFRRILQSDGPGTDDKERNDDGDPDLQVDLEPHKYDGGDDRAEGKKNIQHRIDTEALQCGGLGLFSLDQHIWTEDRLDKHRHQDHDKCFQIILRGLWMKEAVNNVSQHQQAEIQAEDRDSQYRQILDPSVTKGMRPVRGLPGQSGRNDRDQRIQTIRQVVDGVRLDRDGFDLLSGDVFRRKHQELYDQDHSAGTDDLAVADFF